jgi:uncharacterized protein (DUF2384 family)
MNHPNKALANKTPISLLRSRFGVEMVLDELGRMEYGCSPDVAIEINLRDFSTT